MPAAEMISGTTIGDISNPIIVVLNGKSGRLSPSAAKVPRKVAIMVEKNAIMKLFLTAPCQFKLVKNSWYHLVVKASGWRCSISEVKEKNGCALNDNGKIIRIGNIRNANIQTQIVKKQ